jgi:phosphoserine phosphatase RsbU/P
VRRRLRRGESDWVGPANGDLSGSEREFLEALLNLAATSIANARAHQEVLARNQELRALLDLSRGIAAAIEPEEVAHLLMLTLAGRYALRAHGLLTWSEGHENVRRVRGLADLDAAELREALGERGEPLVRDGLTLFPIRTGETTSGVVVVGSRATGVAYTDGDLEFITSLVAQAAVALDNAWRFQDTLYRQHLEEELTLAASIQKDLFPARLPALVHTAAAARNRQAREVGGDYYDALPVTRAGPEESHLFTVADISGKGVGASLLMANIQATLRAVLAGETCLRTVASRTSDLLHASTPGSKYATAIFVQYDPLTGACEYVNGGHNDGVVLRAEGVVELLKATVCRWDYCRSEHTSLRVSRWILATCCLSIPTGCPRPARATTRNSAWSGRLSACEVHGGRSGGDSGSSVRADRPVRRGRAAT